MKILKQLFFTVFLLGVQASLLHAIDVSIPDVSASAGKTFTLAIQSTDLTGAGVFSFDCKIIYDQSILTAKSVSSSGTLISKWGNPTSNIGNGEVRVSAGGTEALSGSGTLMKIVFRVADNAQVGAISPMAFASFMFNEGTPGAAVRNGTFTVIADTAPPVITSGPSAGSVTSRSAVITWRTDEPATSILDYGESTGYGQQIQQQTLVTNHSVTITGLEASRIYHFRVGSADKLGNGPTYSADQTFRSKDIIVSLPDVALDPGASLLVPITTSDLTGQTIRTVAMTIQFDPSLLIATGVSTEGTIGALWPAPSYSVSAGQLQISMNGSDELIGSGTLLKIQFTVNEGVRVGRKTVLAFSAFQFNAGDPPAVTRDGSFTVKDTQPPLITAGPDVQNITSGSALILWETNEKSTSLVQFGSTDSYGRVEKSSSRTVKHQVALSGLNPETTYHFRVGSTDSSGNGPTMSEDFTFTTAAGGDIQVQIADGDASVGSMVSVPVTLSDVSGKGIFSFHTVVKYDRELLEFQDIDPSGSIAADWGAFSFDTVDGQVMISHQGPAPLTGSGTLFTIKFRVKNSVHDADTEIRFARFFFNQGFPEVTARSGLLRITGNADVTPPTIVSGPIVDQISTNSARIFWYTDEEADTRVEWGRTVSYGEVSENASLAKYHSVLLNNLSAGTEYHFRVLSSDASGNGPTSSEDVAFSTLSANGVAVNVPDVMRAAGRSFELPVIIGNVSGLEVYSAYLVLLYDENVLTVNNASTGGTLAAAWGEPVFTITPGRVVIAMGGIKALSGSGKLVKLNVTVRNDAAEGLKTPLLLDRFTFNEGNPVAMVSNGSFTVQDRSAPVIDKGPIAFAVTPTSATILWATDEPATSAIEYGTSTFYSDQKSNENLVTGHLLVLSGLEANTLYHYRISSVDQSGNGPVRSNDFTFVTPAEKNISLSVPDRSGGAGSTVEVPVMVQNVTGLGITTLDFDVDFNADIISYARFSTAGTITENWGAVQVVDRGAALSLSLSGATALSGSGTLVNLYFDISASAPVGALSALEISDVRINGLAVDAEITNGVLLVRDLVAPQITSGPFVNAVTATTAEIFWQTDEPANSVVEYGTTSQLGQRVEQAAFTSEHRVVLIDLAPNTTYYFRVASSDSFANGPTTSAQATFTTLQAQEVMIALPDTSGDAGTSLQIPVRLGDVTDRGITAVSFSVLFDVTVLQINGATAEGTLTAGWESPVFEVTDNVLTASLSGSAPLTGSGTLLFLNVLIKDDARPGATSPLVFTDARFNDGFPPASTRNGRVYVRDRMAPTITSGPFATQVGAANATIVWYTDEASTGIVEFGTTTGYGKSVTDNRLVTEHQILLTDLQPSTEYHFRVGSTDSLGNGPTYSQDALFVTASESGLRVALADTSGSPGQNIVLPVVLDGLDGQDIRQCSLTVVFNPAVLSIEEAIRQNSLTASWDAPAVDKTEDRFSLSISGSSPLPGAGDLIFLRIRISDDAVLGASSLLSFTQISFNDGSLAASARNGRISVLDETPPIITSGPFVSSLTPVSASIYWATDEKSNSLVEYGLTSAYGTTIHDARMVTEHKVDISSLTPGTTFHYRVGSTDSLGNGPVWSADAVFTTPEIEGIYVALPDTGIGADSAFDIPIIIRNSTEQQLQALDFTLYFDQQVMNIEGAGTTGTLLSEWGEPTVSYEGEAIRVRMSGTNPVSGSGILIKLVARTLANVSVGEKSPLVFTSFQANAGRLTVVTKSGSVTIVDVTPPLFVGQPQVGEVLFNGAHLLWKTNEKTTALIDYGLSSGYGSTVTDSQLVVDHDYLLSGLMPATQYHVRIGIIDSSGNGPVYSNDLVFTTTSGEISVSIPDTSAAIGSTIWIPVLVSDLSGHAITRVRLDLQYDPEILTAQGVNIQNTIAGGWSQPIFSDSRGTIQLDMNGQPALAGAGTLIYIGFYVSDLATAGTSVPLTIQRIVLNDGSPAVSSVESGTLSILEGNPQNAVLVSLPDTSVYSGQEIRLPVFVSDLTGLNVFSYDFTIAFTDSVLQAKGVAVDSTVTALWPMPQVEIAAGTVHISGSGTTALADSGVFLELKFRTKPRLVSGTTARLSFTSFRLNNGSPRVMTRDASLAIVMRPDAISGYVYDQATNFPVDSATVTARLGQDVVKTVLTDSFGYFRIVGLQRNRRYVISAEKQGYLTFSMPEEISPGTEKIVLLLAAKDGYVDGTVKDDLGAPVHNALIIADDSHGNFGSANSDSNGYFRINGLARLYPYKIRVTKFGFVEQIVENVSANSSLRIVLTFDYGRISGSVKFADSSAVPGALIVLRDMQNNQQADSAVTTDGGDYEFDRVVAGQYILTVNKPGYLSEPEQFDLTMGPGQKVTANFSLEQAVLHRIVVHGDQEIANDKATSFYYSALTESGRRMGIPEPLWKLLPAAAGSIRNGLVRPNPSYIGAASIVVTDAASELSDTLAIDIYAPVGPQTDRTFKTHDGARLTVVPGSFDSAQKLKLNIIKLPPLKKNAKRTSAQGDGYLLKPDGLSLTVPLRLALPFATGSGSGLVIGRWDKENSVWLPIESEPDSATIVASISSLGLYALLAPSHALGIRSLRFTPNPFSPDVDTDGDGQPGLSIHLTVSSREARMPLVTLTIYNMAGQLVRELLQREPFEKDKDNVICWDGRTDDGRLARNGRYIVRTQVEDASGLKQHLTTVVLIR